MSPPPLRQLYPRLTSFASLHAAAHKARLGKRYRPAVLAFHANLEEELLRLQEELRSFSYRPGPYRQFRIRDPKPRLISAALSEDFSHGRRIAGLVVINLFVAPSEGV